MMATRRVSTTNLMMRPLSVYRRMLCACGIFWCVGLIFVYFYFNDFPKQSPIKRTKILGFAGLDASDRPDASVPSFGQLLVRKTPPRGVPTITNNAEYPEKESLVIKMIAPHMVRKHPRLAEYCNLPNKEITGSEGRPESGENYELLSVHVITRHGDRAYFNKFKGQPDAQLSCTLNKQYMAHNKKIARFETTMRMYANGQYSHNRFKNWALYPNIAICRPGDLTGTGVLQHIVLGDYFRRRYLAKLFPQGIKYGSDLSVRSSETIRTYQSAVAFLYGFLPSFSLEDVNIEPVRSNMCDSNDAEIPCHCPESFKYNMAYEQFATNHNRLDKTYQHIVRQLSDVYGVSTNEIPRNMWTILDPLMVHACHDLPTKCNRAGRCIDGHFIDNLWRIHDNRHWAINHPNKFLQKESALVFYPLLSGIFRRMKLITENSAAPRFTLYSGHDMTLAGMLTNLGVFNGKWSPYAGRIVFELYRSELQGTHHLRILHDGVDITNNTTFCEQTPSGQMCEFSKFSEFVEKGLLTGLFGERTYRDMCNKVS